MIFSSSYFLFADQEYKATSNRDCVKKKKPILDCDSLSNEGKGEENSRAEPEIEGDHSLKARFGLRQTVFSSFTYSTALFSRFSLFLKRDEVTRSWHINSSFSLRDKSSRFRPQKYSADSNVQLTAWKVKFQLKIYSFNRIGMLFGHFNAKT